jgi:hypothetical protein
VIVGVFLVAFVAYLAFRSPRAAAVICLIGVGGCAVAYAVSPSGLRATHERMVARRASTWSQTFAPDQPVGSRFTFDCERNRDLPKSIRWNNSLTEGVWGSDVYSYGSYICWAAVHSGRITPGEAERITVEVVPPEAHYPGSKRNGVSTSEWIPGPDETANTAAFRILPD